MPSLPVRPNSSGHRALCALLVWYGLAPKKGGGTGSVDEAYLTLNNFWEGFVASTSASTMLNLLTYSAFRAEEIEIPVLGVSAPIFGLNLSSAFYKAVAASLPSLGVRSTLILTTCLTRLVQSSTASTGEM